MQLNTLGIALAAVFCTQTMATSAPVETRDQSPKPSIILVHGAYADGTSWSKVIPLLKAKGYHVVSVQNPTTSLADDVAATERVLDQQKGPVVLVGHSWAGVVITEAGNHSNVRALVYVDASAPDSGQSILDAGSGFPAEPGANAGVKDANGYLTLPDAAVAQYFAQDLSEEDKEVIAATQTPWYVACLTDKVTHASWHEKPSWWVIGENDHMINPKLQAKMAETIKAQVTKVPTSHLAMLKDPRAVTAVILSAADAVQAEAIAGGPALIVGRTDQDKSRSLVAASPELRTGPTAREARGPAGVAPLPTEEPPAKLIIDPPLPEGLAVGRAVIQYRAENVRIEQVFGKAALDVSPRIGHIHVTVDDAPWHWLDASGEPLTITGLTPGPHKVLIELVNANHQTLDYGVVNFTVKKRSLTAPDPKADGFRSAPGLSATRQ